MLLNNMLFVIAQEYNCTLDPLEGLLHLLLRQYRNLLIRKARDKGVVDTSMSLMRTRKRRGPMTEAWGTPEMTEAGFVFSPLTRPVCVRFFL